jgi:hypothetical protein
MSLASLLSTRRPASRGCQKILCLAGTTVITDKSRRVGNTVLICLLAVAGDRAWAQTPSLSLSGGSGARGGNVSVAISFVPNGAPATGVQWTMNYSTGDFSSVTVVESATATAEGDMLSCSKAPGQVTCLILNLVSHAVLVPSGQIAVATFQISATTRSSSSAIGPPAFRLQRRRHVSRPYWHRRHNHYHIRWWRPQLGWLDGADRFRRRLGYNTNIS